MKKTIKIPHGLLIPHTWEKGYKITDSTVEGFRAKFQGYVACLDCSRGFVGGLGLWGEEGRIEVEQITTHTFMLLRRLELTGMEFLKLELGKVGSLVVKIDTRNLDRHQVVLLLAELNRNNSDLGHLDELFYELGDEILFLALLIYAELALIIRGESVTVLFNSYIASVEKVYPGIRNYLEFHQSIHQIEDRHYSTDGYRGGDISDGDFEVVKRKQREYVNLIFETIATWKEQAKTPPPTPIPIEIEIDI